MKILTYNIKKVIEAERAVHIKDEAFICVEHRVDGSTRWTAFIGKGESNRDKRMITISPSGDILDIKRMAGSAELNAISLLKRDSFNSIIKNDLFMELYDETKKELTEI